jgi:hypothetical protein
MIDHEELNASPVAYQDTEETPPALSHSDAAESAVHKPTDKPPKEVTKDKEITGQPTTKVESVKAVAIDYVKPKAKWKFWSRRR